ncbi:hypothetical protein R1flu_014326 [Riccia fluitans]|uniref:Nucleolar protein 12 n=1 Tax=Riccia fluitans TaxID=41844 RepID=A0ABD1YG48_9MARC
MNDDGGNDEIERFHVSKRARYNKTSVVVFDDEARKEYLTGFRKRKNKRRQIAAEQVAVKERQKRLQERRERRQALKAAIEESSNVGTEEEVHAEDDGEQEEAAPIASTVLYEEKETMTVVNAGEISAEEHEIQKAEEEVGEQHLEVIARFSEKRRMKNKNSALAIKKYEGVTCSHKAGVEVTEFCCQELMVSS